MDIWARDSIWNTPIVSARWIIRYIASSSARLTISFMEGALPRQASGLQYPNRNNNRGLFAGTRLESTKDGVAAFTLAGDAKGVWVNGTPVPAASGRFTVPVKRGVNTLVVQLNDVTPADITLRSGDVTFVME